MEAVTAPQKNAGPVQVLHRTGAGIEVLDSEQIKLDHFPIICEKCSGLLCHSDLIGLHLGTIFIVKGYRCPACRHTVGQNKRENANKTHVPFNWIRIEMPNKGRFDGRGNVQ